MTKRKINFSCPNCHDVTSWTWQDYLDAPEPPWCRGCRRSIPWDVMMQTVKEFKKANGLP